jgi:hypothetical protein
MRSPVDRALSDYWYCYHESANPAHFAARSMSAAAFCAAGFGQARNGQAKYLSGVAFEKGSPEDEELYVRAQQALGKLDYVGLFETFEQTLDDIADLAGVRKLDAAVRINVAERTVTPTAEELTILRAENRIDQALYETAIRRRPQFGPRTLAAQRPAVRV